MEQICTVITCQNVIFLWTFLKRRKLIGSWVICVNCSLQICHKWIKSTLNVWFELWLCHEHSSIARTHKDKTTKQKREKNWLHLVAAFLAEGKRYHFHVTTHQTHIYRQRPQPLTIWRHNGAVPFHIKHI